jgi:hypothetical protein
MTTDRRGGLSATEHLLQGGLERPTASAPNKQKRTSCSCVLPSMCALSVCIMIRAPS